MSGNLVSKDQIKMLFLGMQAKVKLFIERDTQRSLRDIEESKRQFKVSLEALERQKRKEKVMFARAVNTLKTWHEKENAGKRMDHSKVIEKMHEQLAVLTEIREVYDSRINELKQLGSGRDEEVLAVKERQIASLQELNETLRNEVTALKENHVWLKKDNQFKTEQLNIFLKDCGAKNDQLYELRKQMIETQTIMKEKDERMAALTTQLNQSKVI